MLPTLLETTSTSLVFLNIYLLDRKSDFVEKIHSKTRITLSKRDGFWKYFVLVFSMAYSSCSQLVTFLNSMKLKH